MKFFSTEKLGPTRRLTPEGFLVVEGVALARTGSMVYGPGEVPVEAGPSGLINITREDEDVFRPETLASFNGKPLVDEHPDGNEDVTPENWKRLAKGYVMNTRRGGPGFENFMLGDLMVTDKDAIKVILEDDKTELSCGYSADYEQLEPGRGRQHNIIGNHVALVDQGRCGPRCAIGDEEMKTRDSKPTRRSVMDRIKAAFGSRDAKAFDAAMEEAEELTGDEGSGVTVHLHTGPNGSETTPAGDSAGGEKEGKQPGTGDEAPEWFKKNSEATDKRFADLEATINTLTGAAKAATGDAEEEEEEKKKAADAATEKEEEEKKTGDSASMVAEFKDVVARAEILFPGIKVVTFDAKAKKGATIDAICGMRRKALSSAFNDAAGRKFVEPFLAGKGIETLDTMTCDAMSTMFVGASELRKLANSNIVKAQGGTYDKATAGSGKPAPTADSINKRNKEFWKVG